MAWLSWVNITPFGCPLVPLVYMIVHISFDCGGQGLWGLSFPWNPIPMLMLSQHIYALLLMYPPKNITTKLTIYIDFPRYFSRMNCIHPTINVPTTFKKSFQEYIFIPIWSASLICSLVAEVNATNAVTMCWITMFKNIVFLNYKWAQIILPLLTF